MRGVARRRRRSATSTREMRDAVLMEASCGPRSTGRAGREVRCESTDRVFICGSAGKGLRAPAGRNGVGPEPDPHPEAGLGGTLEDENGADTRERLAVGHDGALA